MSNASTEKILQIVKNAKESASRAENDYDDSARSLQLKAQKTIDLFGGRAVSQVADIVSESKIICDELYAAYQTLVEIVDSQCRPLLDDGPDYYAVREVSDLITWLNEESEIENNFAASFNANNLGDIASRRYIPSMSNKMIQRFWVTKCDLWPGREEAEAELRKKREEEAKRNQMEQEAKRKQAEAEYEKKLKDWQETVTSIEKQRNERIQESLAKSKAERIAEIEGEHTSVINRAEATKQSSEEKLAEAEKKLASLGMFNFAEKKECKETIEKMNDMIRKAKTDCEMAEQKYKKEMRDLVWWLEKKKSQIKKDVERKYPLPEKPRKPYFPMANNGRPLTPTQKAIAEARQAILDTMVPGVEYSIEDLKLEVFELDGMPNQKISALLIGLIEAEQVEKVGRNYILA